jgi:hypothetical protein
MVQRRAHRRAMSRLADACRRFAAVPFGNKDWLIVRTRSVRTRTLLCALGLTCGLQENGRAEWVGGRWVF